MSKRVKATKKDVEGPRKSVDFSVNVIMDDR